MLCRKCGFCQRFLWPASEERRGADASWALTLRDCCRRSGGPLAIWRARQGCRRQPHTLKNPHPAWVVHRGSRSAPSRRKPGRIRDFRSMSPNRSTSKTGGETHQNLTRCASEEPLGYLAHASGYEAVWSIRRSQLASWLSTQFTTARGSGFSALS